MLKSWIQMTIHPVSSLAQEHAAQKGLFTLTATGIKQASDGLLNIAITLHFDVPSQSAVHQVCHFNIAMSCSTYSMLFQGQNCSVTM